MQKQVKDIQTADFATRNDNGLGAFLSALALPSAVAIGLPALASGGTDWGIGSGLAANYAGAGAGAGGAISGVEGAIPGSIGYNVPLSAGDIAAYQGAALNPAATITAKDLGLAGAITGAGAAGSAGGAPAVTNAGVPSIASTTPTGAAGTTGARAPAATTAAAPAAAGTPQNFVDSIISQFKNNALSLGLGAAGLAMSAGKSNEQMPGQATLTGLGENAASLSNEYINAARSGKLTGPQQASLDQYVQQAKNQVRQYFASIGQQDSTAERQAEAQIDQTAVGMKDQLIQSTLQSGLTALGAAQGPLATVAQYQLGQDQALQQALGRFALGAGVLAGTSAGKPTAATTSAK